MKRRARELNKLEDKRQKIQSEIKEEANAIYDKKIGKLNVVLNRWKVLLTSKCTFARSFDVMKESVSILVIYPFLGSHCSDLSVGQNDLKLNVENVITNSWDADTYFDQDNGRLHPIYFIGNINDMFLDWKDMNYLVNWSVRFNVLLVQKTKMRYEVSTIFDSREIMSFDAEKIINNKWQTRHNYVNYFYGSGKEDWTFEECEMATPSDLFNPVIKDFKEKLEDSIKSKIMYETALSNLHQIMTRLDVL